MLTLRDALGRTVEIPERPARVVSLVPSITESLFDLKAGESVVGITDYCIFPRDRVELLPRVGGTKNPDVGRIRELEPDLVYMNQEENVRRHGEEIESFAPVYVSEPKTVFDVIDLLRTLGRIHGVDEKATEFAEQIREESRAIRFLSRFTFAVPIWRDPWMWCGGDTYVSSLVESVGGTNVLREETRYPRLSTESVLEKKPDVVFLPDEPYEFVRDDRDELTTLGFTDVRGPFPGHFFTWHGTRTLRGLVFLREWIA